MIRPLLPAIACLLLATACRRGEDPAQQSTAQKSAPPAVVAAAPTATPAPTPPRKVTTPEGVTIEFTRDTGNAPPEPGSRISLRYTAHLSDGRVVDKSPEGEDCQVVIGEGRLIRGLELALAKFPVGSSARVHVPAALAYADKELGDGAVPAHADLDFDVELTRAVAATAAGS